MAMYPKHIILHCSDTEDGDGMDARAIRRYHVEHNGWRDIGYHYVIERVGHVADGGLIVTPGRPPMEMGAHCRAGGRNYDSIGVCVVGEFDEIEPSTYLLSEVAQFLALLAFVFSIPAINVHGHREYDSGKTCPGKMWPLDYTRHLVDGHLRSASEWGPHIRLDLLRVP